VYLLILYSSFFGASFLNLKILCNDFFAECFDQIHAHLREDESNGAEGACGPIPG
jgi:hypothetical protein